MRVIAATHRNLEHSVKSKEFREDLFYRLNVIPINVPSLSERKEDILLLISYFLEKFVSADGRNSIELEEETLDALLNYDWPGNVRELENLIERLVILKGGDTVKIIDLPSKYLKNKNTYSSFIDLPDTGINLKSTLLTIENSLISQALDKTLGNKKQASELLQINRTTLIEKMKKRNLMDSDTIN